MKKNIENKYPNVAILMPTYNGSRYVEKQITSILNQTDVLLNLYIYDDNSEDNTFEKVSKLKSVSIKSIDSLPDFPSKKSAAKSFFRIISALELNPKYEYVAFSDQDDIWFSNKLSKAINILKNGKFSGYSSSVLAYWANGKTKNIKKGGKTSKFNSLFESAGPGCTYVINREVFDLFKSFLISNKDSFKNIDFHDWAIYSFVMNKGYNWFIDDEYTMFYRQHNENAFGARYSFKQYKKRLDLILNGWFYSQVYLLHKIYLPNSFIVKNPKLIFLYRFYLFFKIIKHRRKFLDKFVLSILTSLSKLKINS